MLTIKGMAAHSVTITPENLPRYVEDHRIQQEHAEYMAKVPPAGYVIGDTPPTIARKSERFPSWTVNSHRYGQKPLQVATLDLREQNNERFIVLTIGSSS